MFNRHFGVELAYIDLGEVSYSGTFSGFPVTGGKVELSAFTVSALGVLPISEQFSVFGKVGLFKWEAEFSDTTGGVPFSGDDDGTRRSGWASRTTSPATSVSGPSTSCSRPRTLT